MDFSGFGNNKTFKAGGVPDDPYYYVQGTLDLAGAVDGGTYYFNLDNSFEYALSNQTYGRYLIIDQTMLISEVIVFSNDDLLPVDPLNSPDLRIGGADRFDPVEPYVKVPWAAPAGEPPVPPPGFVGGDLTLDDVNNGAVNYFGHEGGHFPYNEDLDAKEDTSVRYKYLAVTVNPQTAINNAEALTEQARSKARQKKAFKARALPTGSKVIESGHLSVILKIYPQDRSG